jgi:hypothetical protein
MMKYLWIYSLLLMLVFYTSCEGQDTADSIQRTNKIDDWNKRWKIKDYKLPDIDRETASQGVIIQNSFPKGDGYANSRRKIFSIAIFWTRVINVTANPLELTIHFPVDSIAILSSPDSYLKLFLPPDTMTIDKVPLYGYGLASLRSVLDTGLNKLTMLQRTINPNEEYLFYVGVLRYKVSNQAPATRQAGPHQARGDVTRTGLVLKEQDLFYKISVDLDSSLIPCGQIFFKK